MLKRLKLGRFVRLGLEGFEIGDTVADFEAPEGLPAIAIDEPNEHVIRKLITLLGRKEVCNFSPY